MPKPPRPLGVTVLAILQLIGGALVVLGGIALVALGGTSILSTLGFSAMLSSILSFLGGVLVIVGLLALLFGWGMWSGKGWAWTLEVVFYGIGAIFSLIALVGGASGIVGLLIDVVVLWYLFRPHVKAYFGKGPMPMAPMQAAPAAPAPSPAPAP